MIGSDSMSRIRRAVGGRAALAVAAAVLGATAACPAAEGQPAGGPPTAQAGGLAAVPAPAPATRRAATQQRPPAKYGVFDEGDSKRGYPDTGRLFWEMLAYVVVILVLGGVAIFVIRRVLPRLRTVTGKRVSVLETVYLGPRQTVHLIQAGGRKFLVAGTRERVNVLAEVTGAFPEEPAEAKAPE